MGAIIGNKAATNKAFAHRVGPIFIGCYSHRYNLAMMGIMSGYLDVVDKVHELMKKLNYQIPAAKLRHLTHLTVQKENKTRWSSTYKMVERYIAINLHVESFNILEITELLLDEDENAVIKSLLKKLGHLETVTKALKSDAVTVAEARGLLDAVIDAHPSTDEG